MANKLETNSTALTGDPEDSSTAAVNQVVLNDNSNTEAPVDWVLYRCFRKMTQILVDGKPRGGRFVRGSDRLLPKAS